MNLCEAFAGVVESCQDHQLGRTVPQVGFTRSPGPVVSAPFHRTGLAGHLRESADGAATSARTVSGRPTAPRLPDLIKKVSTALWPACQPSSGGTL